MPGIRRSFRFRLQFIFTYDDEPVYNVWQWVDSSHAGMGWNWVGVCTTGWFKKGYTPEVKPPFWV